MTGRGSTALRLTRVVAGALLLACLVLPLTSRPASACDVSYEYRPSLSLDKPGLGRGAVCSNGTSVAGAVIVAILAIGALAGAGAVAVRRAGLRTRSAPTPPTPGPAQALTAYLYATGIALPAPQFPGPGRPGGGAPPRG